VRRQPRELAAVERDSAFERAMQARERAHQRRFACAVRPEHCDHLASAHIQVDAL
jgi:hypothetical protein